VPPALPAEAPAVGSPQAVLPHDQLHDQRTPRLVPIDNLKAVLVAWVIAGHAFLGYAAMGGWPYDEVAETTLPRTLELLLEIVIGPTALFVIGTFFFLSGLLAPHSLAQHGPGGFVRQRLLRLGLPWLLFTLLIWPLVMWAAYRAAGTRFQFGRRCRPGSPSWIRTALVCPDSALRFTGSRALELDCPPA
jgi:hypothetical protein